MKLNKKGFTLVEIIAVIALIAVIAVIATPNIVRMVDSNKKEQFVSDAKEMISKAKYKSLEKYSSLYIDLGNNCSETTAKTLGMDLSKDPDGNTYNLDESKIKICLDSQTSKYVYYVKTITYDNETNYGRGVYNLSSSNGYVVENNISKDAVVEIGAGGGN